MTRLQVASGRLQVSSFCLLVVVLAWGLALADAVPAQRSGEIPAELEGTGIDEQLGEVIPDDLVFKNELGEDVVLADYFDGERPVLLALVYHECPMLCNMVLQGLTKTLSQMSLTPGREFDVLAVSFNPRETPAVAREEKEMILGMLGNEQAAGGLHFLTGEEEAIAALTDAVGFKYRWIENRQEYAHPSALIFLSGKGKISRYIYGIDYPPSDVRRALVEASDGKVGSTLDQVILYCFQYDPDANSYVPHAVNLMKAGGVLTMLLLGGMLFVYWRRESQRADLQASA